MNSNTATSELTPTDTASATSFRSRPARDTVSASPARFWVETSLQLIADDTIRAFGSDPATWKEWEWYAQLAADALSRSGSEALIGLWESSSLPFEIRNPVVCKVASDQLRVLIRDCYDEPFEDGVKGRFWRNLERFLSSFGIFAVETLQQYCFGEGSNAAVVGEILRCVGINDDPANHAARMRLLTRSLHHRAASVRDAAGIGLSYLNDKGALDELRAAVAREPYEELRNDLRQVVAQLET